MLRPPAVVISGLAILRRRLLAWYDSNRRDLPWRRTADPYRIWLSEIMLQQTRVAAVLDHYRAFLTRFPTVQKLADAPPESVLAAWSGLGYYRRARSLHHAAQQIVARHGSRLPRTLPELRALPGVGRYTSAAVASIAFGVPVAVVDGNVERVISRLLAAKARTVDCWALAERLLERRRPGDWNQAMMELGAVICLPREPQCSACPLQRWCQSSPAVACPKSTPERRRTPGSVTLQGCHSEQDRGPRQRPLLPLLGWRSEESHYRLSQKSSRRVPSKPPRRESNFKPLRRKRHKKDESYLLAQRPRSVYLVRRDSHAKLMAGMWELPCLPHPPAGREPLFKLKHSITVTDYEIAVFDTGKPDAGSWVALKRIPELPLTGLARKILRRAALI